MHPRDWRRERECRSRALAKFCLPTSPQPPGTRSQRAANRSTASSVSDSCPASSVIQGICATLTSRNGFERPVAADRIGGFVRVFSADNFAHKFRREPGVLVREFDSNRLAVHHGQLMAQLI